MKKNKIFKLICCFTLLCCSTLMFAACGGGNPVGGYEGGSTPPKPDPDKQPPSTGDDSDVEIGEDGEIAGGGEVADFSQYFSGYTVLTNGDNTYTVRDEVTGERVKFNDLLDRQIDVLAQDILYRLTYVYGYNGTNHNRTENAEMILKNVDNSNYSKGSNEAKVDSNKLLVDSVKHDSSHTNTNVNVKCVDCMQKSLNIFDGKNYLNNNTYVYLLGAIEGRYTTLNYNALVDTKNSDNAWNWTAETSAYGNYLGQYKNNLKMAIALIINNNENFKNINATYNFDEDLYYDEITKINNLGYFKDVKIKIEEFINNNIIGTDLIDQDWKNLNSDYFKNHNYNITKAFIGDAPVNSDGDMITNYNTINPRFYKGYNIVIPAIVDQALSNIFDGTISDEHPEGITLYPKFARVSATDGTFETYKFINSKGEEVQEMTTTGPLYLNSIILKPKAGSKPVALNLQIAVARDLKTGNTPSAAGINDLSCFAHDVVVDLEVNIVYHRGTDIINRVFQPDGEDSTVLTIDSKGYVPTYIDYEDPNLDPTRAQEEGYLDQFRKPMETNGEILPFTYIFSIYDDFTDETPAFNDYNGSDRKPEEMSAWNNDFDGEESLHLKSGEDYIQFTFNIKSVKKYSGESNELVEYAGNDIVYDIALMPYTF